MQLPLLLNRIPTTKEILQSTDDIHEQSQLLSDRNWSVFFKICFVVNSFSVFLITLNTFLYVVEGKPIDPSSGWRVLFYLALIVGVFSYTNQMTSLFAISANNNANTTPEETGPREAEQ